ncbi:MAG: PAS domain S-box protein, partial [Calditrichota bacterium]
TDRKTVQIALLESEERFRTIFDNAGIGIMLILPDGSIMVSNVAMREMLGFEESTMRGLMFRDFYSHDSGMPEHSELSRILENTAGMYQFDCVLGRKQADSISVHVTTSLVKNSDNQSQFIILMAEDVTERNNALRALVEEKERLSVTLKSIDDGVIAIDNLNRVILANEVAGGLLDCKPNQIIGKPLQAALQNGSFGSGEFWQRLIEDSEDSIHREPLEVQRENGRKLKITTALSAMYDDERKRIGSVIVLRDVTNEIALEEELRRTQKLESLGILAGGIAHDFNNILTAIIGNISLGKLSLSEQHAVSLRLDDAERAAVRAQDLTRQLLTFAKGGAPIKRAASITEIIRETADFVLRGNRTKCEYLFSPDIWNVEVDEGQISQVINNLVINSAQSMPNGGTIHILCENFEAVEDARFRDIYLTPGNYVRIVVGDEGVGIPKQYIEQVFDPYFTTKQKGSGLGLATSYSIIKRHEGYIFVESDYQKGSEFTILLPAKPGLEVKDRQQSQAVYGGNGKILVMDDEETILEVAEAMLIRLGYEAVLCKDGAEGIEAYHQAVREHAPFRAVIADLTVPGGIGGKEMIATLRKSYPDMLALVSSGYSNDPIMAEFREHGFQGRILKPYNVQILGAALKEVVNVNEIDSVKKQ